uniref:procollagen-proline 4-dioxygenase n=1 Tax=Steinernema glaseri TaxID=37863 RepID=A0A1I7Y5P8_9BILA
MLLRGALLLAVVGLAAGDVFTAMADVENLIMGERDVTATIQSYIDSEIARLHKLERLANEYKGKAQEKDPDFVMNPLNAFLLIQQLQDDWLRVKGEMQANSASEFIKNVTDSGSMAKYPTVEDLDGAAVALLRLQDTYKLEAKDLSRGIIGGEKLGRELNAHDCYEIGRVAYNKHQFLHSLHWMEEALRLLELESPPSVQRSEILEYLAYAHYKQGDILEYLAYAHYKQGDVPMALRLTEELYELWPDHPRAKGNVEWYTNMLRSGDEAKKVEDRSRSVERDSYEALCRGETKMNASEEAKLYCYLKMDRPFLKLAPIKVEIVRFDPLAVLFKEVISDYEISVVQQLATPKLRRATVQNAKTGALEHASYRISKSAWLKGYDHPVVDRINRRIDLMTNLNQETAEDLQIANYGIGGHYDPHFDFARKEETNAFKNLGTGNRIATVLFYMSEPSKGGATVFTELGTAAFPTLHNALFWYNLRRDGEGDLRTRHAACPVLTGVKWVSNKWIHERGQEFRRPCGLTPDAAEKFVGDLS